MKKILALTMVMMTGTAFSQTYNNTQPDYNKDAQYTQNMEAGGSTSVPTAKEGVRHMFEFNIDSIEALALSFDKIKTKGSNVDSGSNLNFSMNYAYGVHRLIQAAVRFSYFTGINGSEDEENLNIEVGGIFNLTDDFINAPYISLYVGGGWAQQFGNDASRDDLRSGSLSVGKRWSLEPFGVKHVTYSPEVSFTAVNSTTDESLDYSQSLAFKILQFSVFF